MTNPVQENGQNQTSPSPAVPIVILGTDAILAALPATPVQLAHACLHAGFANVIPVSWGDELIAAAMLRRLAPHGGPSVQCSCPKVAHRLLSTGVDLRPVMVPLVPPPVATARYLRSVSQPTPTRITYVGACPGAVDDAIDVRMSPEELLAMLAEREIVPTEQPRVFEGVIPPDRRRFRSQPGGLPTAEALWAEQGARTLVEIEGEDISTEIAQHLLSGRTVLIDVSTRLGCVCAGAVTSVDPRDARADVVAHEPPRATTPVVNELEPIELDLEVPAASPAPVDILSPTETGEDSSPSDVRAADVPAPTHTPPHAGSPSRVPPSHASPPTHPSAHAGYQTPRISPTPGVPTIADPRPGRSTPAATPRPVMGSVPVARGVDGRALPRAYIARRRPSPRGVDVVPPQVETPPSAPTEPERETPPVDGSDTAAVLENSLPETTRGADIATPVPEIAAPVPEIAAPVPDVATPAPSSATPAPASAPVPVPEHPSLEPQAGTRRPMWLVVLLIVAVLAGVAVGVVVARSLGVR